MKILVRIIVNSVIGLVLIFIWLHFVNINEILSQLSKVNLSGLIPVFFFMLVSPVLRAVRLKIFLQKTQKLKLKDLVFLNGAAMMLNFFIPIRMGEIAKGVYLNTHYNLNLGKSIIWIFLDRFVDFLAVLGVSSLLLVLVPTTLSIKFITIIMIILATALSLTYLAVFRVDFSKKLIQFLMPLLIVNHIKIYFARFSHFILESFSVLRRHPKDLLLLIIITVVAYAADGAIWYFTFLALSSPQNFLKMYLGQVLSALTYLIPAAPGYVGSAEASGLLILSGVFGMDPNLASAMIVLFHILSAIFVIIFGLISIFNLKLDVGLIFKKAFRKNG